MLTVVLIMAIGIAPALLSLWALRWENERAIQRLRTAQVVTFRPRNLPPDYHYVEGIGYMIGDLTCQFNARSSYIRCAVNPMGSCKTCAQYQPLED